MAMLPMVSLSIEVAFAYQESHRLTPEDLARYRLRYERAHA